MSKDITYEIKRHIAVLKEGTGGWSLELNLVSWNEAQPKYDIRFWNEDHDRMMRGLTLDKESAAELTKALEPETGWTRATVFVMLKRLISKNAVNMVQDSGTNVYCPAVRREDIAPAETESFINRVYDGSVGMMFSALTSRKALSEEEIAELRKILDEAEKSEGSK